MVQLVENPLILVDGSSYLYRAYYAFPALTNSLGESTGALYGVLNMLRSLLVQYSPTHFAVVFDANGKTFRDELFKYYKSHRSTMPEGLRLQIEPLYNIVKAMGLPLLSISDVEADDVIGTLAIEAKKRGRAVLISTIDKDMAQLVTPGITLINTMTNRILGPEEVEEKYGVPPALIIDFLALTGDISDNIPGIPGLGKKTAQALLKGLGNMQSIYDNLEKVSDLSFRGAKTIAVKLEQNREIAFLSYQLAAIKKDVKLELSLDALKISAPDIKALQTLFSRYELKSWLVYLQEGQWLQKKKNKKQVPQSTKIEKTSMLSTERYITILDQQTFDLWLEKLQTSDVFAFDLETDSLDNLSASIVGISFAISPGEAAYLPIASNYLDAFENFNRDTALDKLKPLLENANVFKVGKNLKYDRGVLKNYGIELRGIKFDIILESYILNSGIGKHDMDSLAARWLNHKTVLLANTAIKGRNQATVSQSPLNHAAYYASEDADITLQLHLKMWPELKKEAGRKWVFEKIDMPLVTVLSRIERNGVLIDQNILAQHSQELTARLAELKQKAHELAGEPFNLSSTKQLQVLLFEKQGIKPTKKTPGGAPSTSEEVLAKLAVDYPLPKIILEYRALSKLKSTYTDKLPKMINSLSGRVHTSYHQAVTVTGRLSSTDPNLQNIPIRNDEGRRIRQAFIAGNGNRIVAADYSQIELRIMAHLSQDKGLLDAFTQGTDIHRATASEVFGIALDSVNAEQRRSAKAINFGLIYGMSAFGLSRQLKISASKAKKYIDLYFERYPDILRYIENTCQQAAHQGYVETLDGRRVWLPDIKSNNTVRRKSAERAAINAPMQGTAADIIKRAMIMIDNWINHQHSDVVKMIMQVHDELVFEVKAEAVEDVSINIRTLMERSMILDVPLLVAVGVGDNWDEAH